MDFQKVVLNNLLVHSNILLIFTFINKNFVVIIEIISNKVIKNIKINKFLLNKV